MFSFSLSMGERVKRDFDQVCWYLFQMTTGGTESIIMACKAYRDYGRVERGITKPNIVMPRTAHSGFDKAAQYLGLHIHYVDIDPLTTQVDIKKMEKTINRNTVMVGGYL